MMRFFLTAIIFFGAASAINAQWSEQFDGALHPACCTGWSGDTSMFVVSQSERLQLSGTESGGTATLYRPLRSIDRATWTFDVWMDFNPSAFNYADVYVVSSRPADTANLHGYFVRIGYSRDEVSLYRRDGDRVQKIIDGTDGVTSLSSVAMTIRVTRDDGHWNLYRSTGIDSDPDIHEGAVYDSLYAGNNFFGIQCRYTKSRRSGFHFDNIHIEGSGPADERAPSLDSLVVIDPQRIVLFFSEPLFKPVALHTGSYFITALGHPTTVEPIGSDGRAMGLRWNVPLVGGTTYQLSMSPLCDEYFNYSAPSVRTFMYTPPYRAKYRDVVINEILADPLPVRGLPGYEYIELYNTTAEAIHLGAWTLPGAGLKPFAEGTFLPPGAFVLVVNQRHVADWPGAVSWGTGQLLNAGEKILLKDDLGEVIDSLHYDISWYGPGSRSHGGWALEQVNPHHCSSDSSNWHVSDDDSGGTPAARNAVYDAAPDERPPTLVSVKSSGSAGTSAQFDEWVDLHSLRIEDITISPHIPVSKVLSGASGYEVRFQLGAPLDEGRQYTFSVAGVADCQGNAAGVQTGKFVHDGLPPRVREIVVFSSDRAGALFSEKLSEESVRSGAQVQMLPGGMAQDMRLQSDSLVVFDFGTTPQVGAEYALHLSGFTDLHGNRMQRDSLRIRWTLPPPLDFSQLLITEIMADPAPSHGLPQSEYIELYNPLRKRLLTADVQLVVGRQTRLIPAIALDPGQHVALCPRAAGRELPTGNKITLPNWLPVRNRSDTLALYSDKGEVIYAMTFADTWYPDVGQREGGRALEMIDLTRPCAGRDNWSVSRAPNGGTPGTENSVSAMQPDRRGPSILHAAAAGAKKVRILFDEKLHPKSVIRAAIRVEPATGLISKVLQGPLLDEMWLHLADSLHRGTAYTVTVDNVTDCNGNIIVGAGRRAALLRPHRAQPSDVVINEVLYNPRHGGVEFVELYNRSQKHLDLRGWSLTLEREGNIYRQKAIATHQLLLATGAYIVLTAQPYILKADYPRGKLERFHRFEEMPPLSDEGTTIAILDDLGVPIDRFAYHPRLHHAWLDDDEGVSLERGHPDRPSDDAANWSSAAQDHGYATPGLRNSQASSGVTSPLAMSVDPDLIIPQQGGARGRALLTYTCDRPGLLANITVFDMAGRCVKKIAQNANLGTRGSFQWYGKASDGTVVPMGYYIVLVEMFGADGSVRQWKETIVVADEFIR